jgi:hypothetical protein
MPLWEVSLVKAEKLLLWNDFWKQPRTEWAETLKALKDDSLGRTVQIRARNKQEAAAKAQSENPGFVVPGAPQSITRLKA